jgi:hypothetical protein
LKARSRPVISLRCDALPKHSSTIGRLAHLSEELLDIVVSLGEGTACFAGGVIAALTPAFPGALAQITPLGEPMEQRIERARADRIAGSEVLA